MSLGNSVSLVGVILISTAGGIVVLGFIIAGIVLLVRRRRNPERISLTKA